MKKIISTMVFVLMLTSWQSHAQFFTTGYASSIVFIDRSSGSAVGATMEQCEASRQRQDDNKAEELRAMGLEVGDTSIDESLSTPCGPRRERLLPPPANPWTELPFPPNCIYCPMLGPDTFKIYYPDHTDQVTQVFEQFKIGQYNKQLRLLQEQFDLQGFEKEIFYLNHKINIENIPK